ncbi:MAG: hypothetical protein NXH85_01655 [Pseudomonadaceae bacterium]|nr:hypothetical protein [Pseudomonadaceae bacterium]
MKQFICELLFLCAGLDPVSAPLDDLTYANVLYHHYQGDHESALVNTLVAEQQNRLGTRPIRFRLAEGSFAFSERLFGYAENSFNSVAQEELTELERMRLSFHLAREYYRRGDWQKLEEQLAQVDLGKTWLGRERVHPEVLFMAAQVATVRGDFAGAQASIDKIAPDSDFSAYALYNLGVAQRASGDNVSAAETFQRLADAKAFSDESFDLLQRARLALAFLRRDLGEATSAEALLADLPSDSRYRDQALASYAQLAMDADDYELAARIWLTLQKQGYWTPSTASARLGFPTSLEMLSSPEAALTQYREAERSFEARLVTLQDIGARSADPEWVSGLLSVFAARESDDEAMRETVERWQNELGHTDWLEWLAAENVHDVLLQWRDLGEMKSWLSDLPYRLDVYSELADEQQRRAALAGSIIEGEGLLAQRNRVAAGIERLQATLDAISAAAPSNDGQWLRSLATEAETNLLDELQHMRELGSKAMSGDERERWLQRVARLEGTVFWTVVVERNARLRERTKALAEQRAALAEIDARIERVSDAETQLVAGVHTDFVIFDDRAQRLISQVDRAMSSRQEMLAQQLRRGMDLERDRLQQYLLVTRVAIARATDQLAAVTGDQGGALR